MSFKIETQREKGFIELIFEGSVDYKQLLDTRKNIHQIISDGYYKYALIDMRKINWNVDTLDLFNFAGTIKRPLQMQIIIVCRVEDKEAYFLETVAHNKGKFVEIYTDYSKAKRDMEQ